MSCSPNRPLAEREQRHDDAALRERSVVHVSARRRTSRCRRSARRARSRRSSATPPAWAHAPRCTCRASRRGQRVVETPGRSCATTPDARSWASTRPRTRPPRRCCAKSGSAGGLGERASLDGRPERPRRRAGRIESSDSSTDDGGRRWAMALAATSAAAPEPRRSAWAAAIARGPPTTRRSGTGVGPVAAAGGRDEDRDGGRARPSRASRELAAHDREPLVRRGDDEPEPLPERRRARRSSRPRGRRPPGTSRPRRSRGPRGRRTPPRRASPRGRGRARPRVVAMQVIIGRQRRHRQARIQLAGPQRPRIGRQRPELRVARRLVVLEQHLRVATRRPRARARAAAAWAARRARPPGRASAAGANGLNARLVVVVANGLNAGFDGAGERVEHRLVVLVIGERVARPGRRRLRGRGGCGPGSHDARAAFEPRSASSQ